MEILRFTLDKLPEKEDKLSLTLGYFDGFHLGHQALAFKAFEASEGLNAILLFDLPVSSFPNRNSTACLSSLEQKLIQASRNRFERAYVLEADSSFFERGNRKQRIIYVFFIVSNVLCFDERPGTGLYVFHLHFLRSCKTLDCSKIRACKNTVQSILPVIELTLAQDKIRLCNV